MSNKNEHIHEHEDCCCEHDCCCHEHEHDHCDCGEKEHSHECACGCEGEHEEESKLSKILLGVAVALAIISLIPFQNVIKIIIQIVAVILAAYPIALNCPKNIKKLKLTETELMVIAIIAACCLGEFVEAVAVAALYRIGEMLEDKAIDSSRKSIDAVSKIQQDFAHVVLDDGTTQKVPAEEIKVGTKISVLPHERFPIDGIVYSGTSTADASAITGESMPITISKGSEVKSGMVNGEDSVVVYTTEKFENSTASRIVKMVEDAAEKKGNTQKFITRFAKIYTPVVVGVAIIIALIGSIATKQPADWIYRALIFLVASCPCALVISVPLGFYTGLGTAAKKGIIVKGSIFIESFAHAKAVVFDKTGTLTTGTFEVEKVTPLANFTEDQVMNFAAIAEHFSSHPIARGIVAAGPEIDESKLSDFSEIAGRGASIVADGVKVLCGSKKLLAENGIETDAIPDGEICVAVNSKAIGSIALRSTLRNGADKIVEQLKSQGIEKTFILTGDNKTAAEEVARACHIDEFRSELMPEDKLNLIEEIKAKYGKTIYVGDGINDAPVLAASDAGVSMGLGTQAANEASDVILTNDKLENLAPTHKLFKRTMNVVTFNIAFSLAVKLIVLLLGVLGFAPIWLAVFADVGVTLICVLISTMIGSQKI